MFFNLLCDSSRAALDVLRDHWEMVVLRDKSGSPLESPNVGESTLRSFVLAEIMRREPNARCQTEWTKNRYDLLLTLGDKNCVVEFKFYGYCRGYDLDRTPERSWKGFPSEKNREEFCACFEKLKTIDDSRINSKFLVLVYQTGRLDDWTKPVTYDRLYSDLSEFAIIRLDEISRDRFACKLLQIG